VEARDPVGLGDVEDAGFEIGDNVDLGECDDAGLFELAIHLNPNLVDLLQLVEVTHDQPANRHDAPVLVEP
jgi:hypothetical protein